MKMRVCLENCSKKVWVLLVLGVAVVATPPAWGDALHVTADGDVGIGTDSPNSILQVVSSDPNNIWLEAPNLGFIFEETDTLDSIVQHLLNNSVYRIRGLSSSYSATNVAISFPVSGDTVGVNCTDGATPAAASTANFVVGDGDGCDGVYTAITAGSLPVVSSSRALKKNLQPVASEDILEKIAGVEVYTYDFLNGTEDQMGLVAEDFHQVFGRGSDKMLSTNEVQMALWLAVQELTGEIEALKAELAAERASVE